MFLQTVIKGIY